MEQLSKKEANRVNSSLRQSQLGLFDTKDKMASS